MKPLNSALIAAAFAASLSIPAFAQDTTQTTTTGTMPAAGDPSAQAPAADPMTPPAAPADSTMPAPADSTMPAPTGPGAMPSGAMASPPASGMASPPAGGMAMSNAPAAGDPSTYPVCSKTVRDRCINRDAKRMMKH